MILIIGAGLSGLLTAYRLKNEGIPFKVLEARSRIGGRINTVHGINDTPAEMGATWFGNQHKHLIALLSELNIHGFEQYMEGLAFFQQSSDTPAQPIQIPNQAPSYRIAGGTSHLIQTLYQKLDKNEVLLNQPVREIKWSGTSVQVITHQSFHASSVILSVPPKLWVNRIMFEPPLPNNLINIAKQTHTWMEDSIKVALTYEAPFWSQDSLSGALFSNSGPITEFYDHCNHQRSKYALCGFMNPAYKDLSAQKRQLAVKHQITSVFGEKAGAYIDYKECVWSNEQYTYEASVSPLYPHQNNGNSIFRDTFFDGRLIISSSESASEFAGYMDGAVLAANTTAKKIAMALNS